MSKTQQLNQLFDKWEHRIPECRGLLVRDGIINEDMWNLTNPKILFIAKEPNQYGNSKSGDFRSDWNSGNCNYPFAKTISECAFGILEGFKVYTEIGGNRNRHQEYLQKIAFLNIKKTGGLSQCDEVALWNHLQLQGQVELIQKEIEIINPEIIVLGLSFQNRITELIFPGILEEMEQCGYMIEVANYNNRKIIDFYHPSSRNTGPATYSLLQNVMHSEVYQSL
ncbi:MAG: hypothetical protein ACJ748_12950 [Flavisolibacter sp.]